MCGYDKSVSFIFLLSCPHLYENLEMNNLLDRLKFNVQDLLVEKELKLILTSKYEKVLMQIFHI